jgi:hypothetical protein
MAEKFEIKRAERKQARLRLALQGPSGSGKTATSLLVAKGLVEGLVEAGLLPHALEPRIGLIDTERKSAQLYSHLVPFDTIELDPPFTTDRYLGALHALEAAGYPVVVLDQISHEWAGKGGIISKVSELSRGGNAFTDGWGEMTPVHDEFVDAMLRSPAHLIVTMRSKTAWVIEQKENSKGRLVHVPTRVGMAPVQRPGIEYEFTTLLALDTDKNKATVLKDRTEMFGPINSVLPRLGPEQGAKLVKWLLAGAPLSDEDRVQPTAESRAIATAEAAERTFPGYTNLPDLARAFEACQRALRAMVEEIDRQVLQSCLDRATAAKDKRKAELAPAKAQAPAVGTAISPQDVANLEELLSAGRVPRDELLVEFSVSRLSELQIADWDSVMASVISRAGALGYELEATPLYQEPPPPPPGPAPKEKLRQVMDREGARRAGGSFFDDFPDDIPY